MSLRVFFFLFTFYQCIGFVCAQNIPNTKKRILIFKIDEDIDPGMNRRVKLALEEAERLNSDIIIIEMDTYGGAVNDADDIRTMILESTIPVYVFINNSNELLPT